MAHYEKLVRDKIPEYLDQKRVSYGKRIADPKEYKEALITKLIEEVEEFSEAGAVEELADVLEVITSLRALPEYENVEEFRKKKFDEKGGFGQRIILKGEK